LNGANRRADAERLAHHVTVDARRNILEAEALHQGRRAARDLHALDATPHAAARLVERLPVLGGDDARKLLEMLLEQCFVFVEDLRPRVHRRVAPRGKRARRRLDGGVHVAGGGQRRPADDISDRGIVDVEKLGRVRRHPAAGDEIVENLNV